MRGLHLHLNILARASSFSPLITAGVAQSVEQRTRNAKVVGSIPISGTISPVTVTRTPRPPRAVFFRLGLPSRPVSVLEQGAASTLDPFFDVILNFVFFPLG